MLLAAAVALAPGLVAFSAPGEPALRLIPELGKAVGLRMEASPAMAREVLLVRVKDAPLADLLKRIAEATGGEWEHKDGVYRLGLSGPLAAQERVAEASAQGAAWHAAIVAQQARRQAGQYSDGTPGLVEAALANLPPEELGERGGKGRVLFSTRPTAAQRDLPASTLAGVDLTRLSPTFNPGGPGPSFGKPGPIAVVVLTVQFGSAGDNLHAMLVAADAQGRVVASSTGTVYRSPVRPAPQGDPPALPRPDASVRLSDEETKRAAALAAADPGPFAFPRDEDDGDDGRAATHYTDAELTAPSPARRYPEFLRPETAEPLGLVAGPLLTRLAEGQGQGIVADLPDGAFAGAATLGARTDLTAAGLAREARATMGVDVRKEAGGLVVRPLRPAAAREARTDRAALGSALRAIAREGTLGLDGRIAYAESAPLAPATETLEGSAFGAVSAEWGKAMAGSVATDERLTLRVMGPLRRGRTTGAVAFGSLPVSARDALTTLAFDGYAGPSRTVPYETSNVKGGATYRNSPDDVLPSLTLERTVYWPDGIPNDATVRLDEATETATFGLAPSGARPRISEYGGGYSMRRDGNGPMVTATALPRLARYTAGTLVRTTLTLIGVPSAYLHHSVETVSIDPKAPNMVYDDLPEALRKAIEENEARMRKAMSPQG